MHLPQAKQSKSVSSLVLIGVAAAVGSATPPQPAPRCTDAPDPFASLSSGTGAAAARRRRGGMLTTAPLGCRSVALFSVRMLLWNGDAAARICSRPLRAVEKLEPPPCWLSNRLQACPWPTRSQRCAPRRAVHMGSSHPDARFPRLHRRLPRLHRRLPVSTAPRSPPPPQPPRLRQLPMNARHRRRLSRSCCRTDLNFQVGPTNRAADGSQDCRSSLTPNLNLFRLLFVNETRRSCQMKKSEPRSARSG